jgi:hypothetical protein
VDTEPVNIDQPAHPTHALTTYELRNYRRQLEHALRKLPEHAEVRLLIRQRLDEVLTEQEDRTRHSTGDVR